MPRLYVFSGLPGVGKTTIARLLAKELGATYLRVDSIETALVREGVPVETMNGKGYAVCYAVALDNMIMGHSVVADMVNPIELTRNAWSQIASDAHASLLNIEVVCSDLAEHRRRLEQRHQDIPGHCLPTWEEVTNRDYQPWAAPVLTLDTAYLSPVEALAKIKTLAAVQ